MESLLHWGIDVIVRFGLRRVFKPFEPAALFRIIRYALVGLWGALGAPWLFVQLKLAQKD